MSQHVMKLPDLGEGVVEAELVAWLVAVGAQVRVGDPLAEVLTDKASVEISSPVDGTVAELLVEAGTVATVGSPLARFTTSGAPLTEPAPVEPVAPGSAPVEVPGSPPAPEPPQPPTLARALAAPTVRRLAADLGVDLSLVAGTGPHGRVVRADVERHARGARTHAERAPDVVEPVRGMRRAIARRLTDAWAAPHITYVEDVDLTALEALRATLNAEVERDGATHLTLLPFIARAVVLACQRHPRMNAHYHANDETLVTFGAVHLGVATQADRGLVVPVVRDADRRSLSGLAGEVRRLSGAARDGSVERAELNGSTITLTSLGALGGLMNTPLLNAPEVAIVGVNKLQTLPRWDGTAFRPAPVVNLSASFDHRIVDGWDAAQFVQEIKRLLEVPSLLSFGWER